MHNWTIVCLHRSTVFKGKLCSLICLFIERENLREWFYSAGKMRDLNISDDPRWGLDILDTVECLWTSVSADVVYLTGLLTTASWSKPPPPPPPPPVLWHDDRVASTSLNTCFDTFLAVFWTSRCRWCESVPLFYNTRGVLLAMQNVWLLDCIFEPSPDWLLVGSEQSVGQSTSHYGWYVIKFNHKISHPPGPHWAASPLLFHEW